MTAFRDDPYWQKYWQDERRDRKITMYAFAPFFELTGALLRAGAALELPYRRRRSKALFALAQDCGERAFQLRQNGVGWAAHAVDDGGTLFRAIHRRTYFGTETDQYRSEVLARTMIEAAAALLFLFEPMFVRIEREVAEEAGMVHWFYGMLESLTDLLGTTAVTVGAPEMLRTLGQYAVMQECEGLAYQAAMIEDGLRSREGKRRKRPPSVDPETVARLAEEIGVQPELLADVLSDEYSAWWTVKREYEAHAARLRDGALSGLRGGALHAQAYRAAWEVGSTHLHNGGGYPYCGSLDAYDGVERTTKLLIAMFRSFPESGIPLALPEDKRPR